MLRILVISAVTVYIILAMGFITSKAKIVSTEVKLPNNYIDTTKYSFKLPLQGSFYQVQGGGNIQ